MGARDGELLGGHEVRELLGDGLVHVGVLPDPLANVLEGGEHVVGESAAGDLLVRGNRAEDLERHALLDGAARPALSLESRSGEVGLPGGVLLRGRALPPLTVGGVLGLLLGGLVPVLGGFVAGAEGVEPLLGAVEGVGDEGRVVPADVEVVPVLVVVLHGEGDVVLAELLADFLDQLVVLELEDFPLAVHRLGELLERDLAAPLLLVGTLPDAVGHLPQRLRESALSCSSRAPHELAGPRHDRASALRQSLRALRSESEAGRDALLRGADDESFLELLCLVKRCHDRVLSSGAAAAAVRIGGAVLA